MKSFLTWLNEKSLSENDLYKKFDAQKAASVAQALASSGDNPNPDIVAKSVVNDPKLKTATPRGLKPDTEAIKGDIASSIKSRQEELKRSQLASKNGSAGV